VPSPPLCLRGLWTGVNALTLRGLMLWPRF
jgi:hypothetical protein